VLRAAQKRRPAARGLLVALVTIHRERGALREARAWARRLVEAAPATRPPAPLPPRSSRQGRARHGRLQEEDHMAIDPAECRAWAAQAKAAWK